MEKENVFDYLFKDNQAEDNKQAIEIKNYFKLIEIEDYFKKEGLENEALEVTSWYVYNIEYVERETERSYKIKNGKWKYKNEREKIDFLKEIKNKTEKLWKIMINKHIIVDKIYWKKHWNQSLEELWLDNSKNQSDKIKKLDKEEVNNWLKKMLTEYKSAKNKKTKIKKKKNIKEYCYKSWIIIKT